MELVHMILKKCDSRRMATILRSYLAAILLAKQLVFSLYFIPATDLPEEKPANDPMQQVIAAETFTSFNETILQLIRILTRIESAAQNLPEPAHNNNPNTLQP